MGSTIILRRRRQETPRPDGSRVEVVTSGSPGPAEKPGTKSPRDRARQLHGEVMSEFRGHGAVVDWEGGRRT